VVSGPARLHIRRRRKIDPEIADEIKTYMVALIEFPARAHAAE